MDDKNSKEKLQDEKIKLVLQRQADANKQKRITIPKSLVKNSTQMAKKLWKELDKA